MASLLKQYLVALATAERHDYYIMCFRL